MINLASREVFVFAGLLAAPAIGGMAEHRVPGRPAPPPDTRIARLRQFFAERACPIESLAPEFIAAADENALDWRLLPSIAFVESGGGKDYRNNNIFGWDSGQKEFPSVRAGIRTVAARLGTSRLYRDKDVDG